MPPKKAKKGSKKGKKKGSKSKKDKLSSNEKFLQFQISTLGDAKIALKTKRDSLEIKNETLQAIMDQILEDRNRVVRLFRQQTSDIEHEIQDVKSSRSNVLQCAIESKHALMRDQDVMIEQAQKSVQETTRALASVQGEVDFLQNYRNTENVALAKQIKALSEALEDEKSSFEREKRAVLARFERSKQLISGDIEESTQQVQRRASDFALGRLHVKEKLVWTDVQWLRREYTEHAAENQRLVEVCESLEDANVRILRKMVGSCGEFPVWWESASSYKEHNERQRLQAYLASLPEDDGDDDADNSDERDVDDSDPAADNDDKFLSASVPVFSPTHVAAMASPLPPMRCHMAAARLSRPSLSSSTQSPIRTEFSTLPSGAKAAAGAGPKLSPFRASFSEGPTPLRSFAGAGQRRSSSSSPEWREDLQQRVESLVIFPKLAQQGSAPQLVAAAPSSSGALGAAGPASPYSLQPSARLSLATSPRASVPISPRLSLATTPGRQRTRTSSVGLP